MHELCSTLPIKHPQLGQQAPLCAYRRHTGHELPIDVRPLSFGSWMGGDRDGNPNVTAKTTADVACLARWMAADLYLREIDALRFELSMRSANEQVSSHGRDVAGPCPG